MRETDGDWHWGIVGMHSIETRLEWEEGIENERGRHWSPPFSSDKFVPVLQRILGHWCNLLFLPVWSSNQGCNNRGRWDLRDVIFQIIFLIQGFILGRNDPHGSHLHGEWERDLFHVVGKWLWHVQSEKRKGWKPEKEMLKVYFFKVKSNLGRTVAHVWKMNIHSSAYFLSECLRSGASFIPFDVCSDVAREANL